MKAVLGTMTFSDQVDKASTQAMIDIFLASGFSELDTANFYHQGNTESLLGELLSHRHRADFVIASKVHPWNDRGLQPSQIHHQLDQTLNRLRIRYLDLLYLHSPDLETPIEKTLAACFDVYQQGKFRSFGLSNYAAWQVAEIVELCRTNGWMIPTVYQGMYNALTRDVEKELFACLRHYGIQFYAYNPLAGGLLTGKHQGKREIPEKGRFQLNGNYRDRYWKDDYLDILQMLAEHCTECNLSMVDVAISWLVNHSMLDTKCDDAVILGASSIEQLDENLQALNARPLDQSTLDILDQGWEKIKPNCFKYFRP